MLLPGLPSGISESFEVGLGLPEAPRIQSAQENGKFMFSPRTHRGTRTMTAGRTDDQLTLPGSGEEGSAEEVAFELGL